jgi:hypothetical protein
LVGELKRLLRAFDIKGEDPRLRRSLARRIAVQLDNTVLVDNAVPVADANIQINAEALVEGNIRFPELDTWLLPDLVSHINKVFDRRKIKLVCIPISFAAVQPSDFIDATHSAVLMILGDFREWIHNIKIRFVDTCSPPTGAISFNKKKIHRAELNLAP